MLDLSDPLDGIFGPTTLAGLESIGVTTVGALVRYAPRRWVRRGQVSQAQDIEAGEWLSIVGEVVSSATKRMTTRRGSFLKVVVKDDRQVYEATFFNAAAIGRIMVPGTRVMLAGTVKFFRGQPQLTHPQWLLLPADDDPDGKVRGSAMLTELWDFERDRLGDDGGAPNPATIFERPIMPMYPATSKIQSWEIWTAVRQVLDMLGPLPEALDESERRRRDLMTTDEAIRTVHLPDRMSEVDAAQDRLKFDEALAIQLVLAQRRLVGRDAAAPACPHVDGGLEDRLRQRLPFTLTRGQVTVSEDIDVDIARTEPMNRLLQGEVGSGKTLVALLAMLRVIDSGHQCVLMAPTEVLAGQHFRSITAMLGDLGYGERIDAAEGATAVALVTGSMKTKEKRQTLLDVVTGKVGIIIGTHALLEENVTFFDLGLVIVDEQHRFGVEQRDTLRGRGRDGAVPHLLVMTATPIPRTVAMTAFGDLDTSVLAELPAGRQPITSTVVPADKPAWVARAWERVGEEVAAGRQVYVVCSRIGEDPDAPAAPKKKAAAAPDDDTISVVEQYEELLAGPLGTHRIGLLHGRMASEDKAAVMDAFSRGEIDILVSTTVIEVGVDVPNATTMVIMDAERFGVSQLHQLRGRVGRGGLPGLCLLMTGIHPQSPTMQRLRAVAATNDGFTLAEIDLTHRKEGDVLGSLQSGAKTSLHFLSLLEDGDVLADARALAQQVVAEDLTLRDHHEMAALVGSILVADKIDYLDKS
ncbi:ATP-dependent DNA helicase RecG [Gordonia sp. NPDC003950]